MRRLAWIDCETTGTDPYSDRIVELAIVGEVDEDLEIRVDGRMRWLVNPGVPIPAEASEVHGITDEDVRDAPKFAAIAPRVQEALGDPDVILAGYNSASFDVCIIDAELRRAGEPGLDLSVKRDLDVLRIWKAIEERTLEGAVLRWLGRPHEDAHGALSDAHASRDVFRAMGLTLEEGLELTFGREAVDRDGKFKIEGGRVCFAFGKHEGKPAVSEPGYLRWILENDFSPEVKAIARRALAHVNP